MFTNDGTARAGVRLDYAGGVTPDGQALFLKMGGFFDENVQGGTRFPLPAYEGRKTPNVNFKKLQKLEK